VTWFDKATGWIADEAGLDRYGQLQGLVEGATAAPIGAAVVSSAYVSTVLPEAACLGAAAATTAASVS
jgi:hypothetical protein